MNDIPACLSIITNINIYGFQIEANTSRKNVLCRNNHCHLEIRGTGDYIYNLSQYSKI